VYGELREKTDIADLNAVERLEHDGRDPGERAA
jgi:hypothetical protein